MKTIVCFRGASRRFRALFVVVFRGGWFWPVRATTRCHNQVVLVSRHSSPTVVKRRMDLQKERLSGPKRKAGPMRPAPLIRTVFEPIPTSSCGRITSVNKITPEFYGTGSDGSIPSARWSSPPRGDERREKIKKVPGKAPGCSSATHLPGVEHCTGRPIDVRSVCFLCFWLLSWFLACLFIRRFRVATGQNWRDYEAFVEERDLTHTIRRADVKQTVTRQRGSAPGRNDT